MASRIARVLASVSLVQAATGHSVGDALQLMQAGYSITKETLEESKPMPTIRVPPAMHQEPKLTTNDRTKYESQGKMRNFGEPMKLNLRDPSGRELTIAFRRQARFGILFDAACQQWSCKVNHTQFRFRGNKLNADLTPELNHMTDGDLIEVDGMELQAHLMHDFDKEARSELNQLLKDTTEHSKEQGMSAGMLKHKLAKVKARFIADQQKLIKSASKQDNKAFLIFRGPYDDYENVFVTVQKDIPLQAVMDYVAKKMGVPRDAARFYYGPLKKLQVGLEDTVLSLKTLTNRDEVEIKVHAPRGGN